MTEAVISWRLDLVVNLIDATNGKTIQGNDVRFMRNGEKLRLMSKGEAGFILLNDKRENFCLKVSKPGFEEADFSVEYEKLDKATPTVIIFLLPLDSGAAAGSNIVSFSGVLPGIEAIEAVSAGPAYLFAKEFNEKKMTMTLWNPHHLAFADVYYGIRSKEGESFTEFIVKKNLTDESVVTDRAVDMAQLENGAISRIIFGRVGEDGSYLLRVRNERTPLTFIVKYVVNKEERYKVLDLGDPENGGLT